MPVYKDKQRNTYYYEGSYVDVFGNNRRYKKRGFKSSATAKQLEREFLINAKSSNSQDSTFKNICLEYLEHKKKHVKQRTITEYKNRINSNYIDVFGKFKMNKITVALIEQWQSDIYDNHSDCYLVTLQQHLKSIFCFSLKRGYIVSNPFDKIEFVRKKNQSKETINFFTYEQYMSFREIVKNKQELMVFDMLYFTGMRIGEALSLNWNTDIDLENATIYIHKTYDEKNNIISETTKNGSVRTIDIPKFLLDNLKEWYEYQSKFDGFSNYNYILFHPLRPSVSKNITNHKDQYILDYNSSHDDKLPRIRIHDFRHSHVSLLTNNDFDSWDIAKRLGHSKEMVDRVYSHMFPEKRAKLKRFLDTL